MIGGLDMLRRIRIAQRWPVQSKSAGVVHEPIEDGVGEGRLGDDLVRGWLVISVELAP